MNTKRFYTYAAVTETYWQQCGEAGVLDFFRSSFAQCVSANGGYSPRLESWTALSLKEAKAISLSRHPQMTWYRIDGTCIEGRLVGAVSH